MKERPILMTGRNVQRCAAGTKTQTRRVLTPQPQPAEGYPLAVPGDWAWCHSKNTAAIFHDPAPVPPRSVLDRCPYGQVGDRLWVRETWRCYASDEYLYLKDPAHIRYRADAPPEEQHNWKPSIYMPRWACRLTLEIAEVRVERLQRISEEDAVAEGVERERPFSGYYRGSLHKVKGTPKVFPTAAQAFADSWDAINGKHDSKCWNDNPWVWAITFRRIHV